MKEAGKNVPKRVDTTRWSSRYVACKNLCESQNEILQALSLLEIDKEQKPKTRCEVRGLIKELREFKFIFLSLFWNVILERFYHSNTKLRNEEGDLKLTVQLYQSLTDFCLALRTEDKFKQFLKDAEKIEIDGAGCVIDNAEGGRVRRKLVVDESRENEVIFEKEENLRINIYFVILDTISNELNRRQKVYIDIMEKFSFLFNLTNLGDELVQEEAKNLQQFYNNHIEETFPAECVHYKAFLKTVSNSDGWTMADFYR